MGCWDVFCFICGNPCHSMLKSYIDYVEEMINEEINSSYKPFIKKMIKDLKERPNIIKELKDLYKNTLWMNKCSMLLANDKVVHNLTEDSCNIVFVNKSIAAEHMTTFNNLYSYPYGIFIHTDCLKYIKKEYKIDLKFSYLPPVEPSDYKLFNVNYGDIEKYWEQEYNFKRIILDNKKYLCSSPLKNDKNIKQIKKNINNFKLKNDPNRKGPMVSATFYNEGEIKIGNNNKFWIIKGNKWIEMNDKIINIKLNIKPYDKKLTSKERKYLENLSFRGESNTEPIFINNILEKGAGYELELILLELYRDILFKNIKSL